MIQVAIVDDEPQAAQELEKCLHLYEEESKLQFEATLFPSGDAFLQNYQAGAFQIVFMDIEMPGMDGMETSRRLRALDKDITLVFVTNLAQYAIQGYEVGALDFILKPINYFSFKLKISKAVAAAKSHLNTTFTVRNEKGLWYIKASELCYLEVMKHDLIYHTTTGSVETVGSLKQEEKRLTDLGFFRCNYCYLVNLRYVSGVSGNLATVNGETLEISRNRKKDFLRKLSEFYGEGGGL